MTSTPDLLGGAPKGEGMHYRISRPMLHTPAADEAVTLFVRHAKRLTLRWVTVAAPYKPTRLERCLCEVPGRFATQGARMLLGAFGAADDAYALTSEHITPRPEWTITRLLRPTPDAAPLDGRTLAACASAALTVWYTRGRCGARIALSEQDSDLLHTLEQAGWLPQRHRIPWARLRPRRVLGPWTGTPSLVPVPLTAAALPMPDTTPAPAAELHGPGTQLVQELEADQDHQLATWLATDIRAVPMDATATVLALPQIVDRDGVVVSAPPMTGRTRPMEPRAVEAALRAAQTDIDDRPTTAFVRAPAMLVQTHPATLTRTRMRPPRTPDVRPACEAHMRGTL